MSRKTSVFRDIDHAECYTFVELHDLRRLWKEDGHSSDIKAFLDWIESGAPWEEVVEALDALKLIAIEGQDDRPVPGSNWDDPFDWRARSMKQEAIARSIIAAAGDHQ